MSSSEGNIPTPLSYFWTVAGAPQVLPASSLAGWQAKQQRGERAAPPAMGGPSNCCPGKRQPGRPVAPASQHSPGPVFAVSASE